MATRPDDVLEWATEDITETKDFGTGQGVQAYANKLAPAPQLQASGILAGQSIYRSIYNYLFNYTLRFIKHLDERYAVGDVHLTTSNESITQISNRLGGTWESKGTEDLGSVTVNVYEKTA